MPLLGIAKDMHLSSPNSRAISISSLACILVEYNSLTTCSEKILFIEKVVSWHIIQNGFTYSAMSIKVPCDYKVDPAVIHPSLDIHLTTILVKYFFIML